MEILFFLIPLSLVLLGLAIWAFFWAVKSDQFDDLDGPAYSILFDDEKHEQTLKEDTEVPSSASSSKKVNNN